MGAAPSLSPITTLKQEFDRLFDRFAEPGWLGSFEGRDWDPKVDVTETKENIVVTAEVPGIEPNDIRVSLADQILTIAGEKQQETEEKDARMHRKERSYGVFERAFRLPAAVDGSKTTATFKNGILTVTLPKTVDVKGTTIPIKPES